MSSFTLHLSLGFDHILDWAGFDHILFIIALCAVYSWRQWRSIIILVTAFTIGHSLTLALSAFSFISVPSELIEKLIPLTIILTAFYNILKSPSYFKASNMRVNYALALFFGFIHGMAFSNYFRSLLGQEADIILPLLAFNIGLELGQLIIVGISILAGFILMDVFPVKHKDWSQVVSSIVIGISLKLFLDLL